MSSSCPSTDSLQTSPGSYANTCLISNTGGVAANASIITPFTQCCTANGASVVTNTCFIYCSLADATAVGVVSDCIDANVDESAIDGGCTGDVGGVISNPSSGSTQSVASSTFASTSPSGTAPVSVSTTAPPKTSSTASKSSGTSTTSSGTSTTSASASATKASKASSGQAVSYGTVAMVGLVLLGLLA